VPPPVTGALGVVGTCAHADEVSAVMIMRARVRKWHVDLNANLLMV
jgi:hypothetical protein